MTIFQIDISTRTNRRLEKMTKERKMHPSQGDDASTVWAGTCRGGRGEQSEARPEMSAPGDGPHLDLGRLRLKAWYKSDFSIAGTTWPTYLYIYFYFRNIFEVLLYYADIKCNTCNNIWYITVVSQEHVLVCITRKVTRPEMDIVLVLASIVSWLMCGWSNWTWFQCGGSELTWFQY